MIVEVLFTAVVLATLAMHVWFAARYFEQERRFMKMIKSRDLQEFIGSELAEKPTKPDVVQDDVSPLEDLSDIEFSELIKKQMNKDTNVL